MSSEKLEIKGRLLLWMAALGECDRILRLVERNDAELKSGKPSKREEEYGQALEKFASSQSDYVPGVRNLAHSQAFSKIKSKEYPSRIDCVQIRDSCHMLVIILFCQIFKGGNAEQGKVADNKKTREVYLEPILAQVFSKSENRERFDELLRICLKARAKHVTKL